MVVWSDRGFDQSPLRLFRWMRLYVGLVLDTAEISCEIDGVPVRQIAQCRHQSPAATVILSDKNLPGLPPGQ